MISGQFIKIYLTPDTPLWALLLFITVPVCYASYKGAGTIGRLAPFFVSFLMLSIILFFIFGIDKIDLNELRPVAADSSFLALNEGAFLTATRYSEILIFFVFAYYIKRQASIIKTFAVSLAIFAVFFMLMLIPVLTVLGSEYAKHIWSAYYIFSRQVEMFDFLERVQALNVLAWFPCSILKLSIYNYMASQVFSGMVRAKTHRYFVIPLAFAAYFICLLPVMGKTETFEFLTSDRVFPFILLPVVFILPIIILAIYIMRRKKIKYHLEKQIQLNDDLAK